MMSSRDRYELSVPFLRNISSTFYVFLLWFAFIGISLKIAAIVKSSPFVLLSVLTYLDFFCLYDLIQIRAGCAIGFFLYSLRFLIKGEKCKYVFFILLGSLFHYSVLVCLCFVILNTTKYNKNIWMLIILCSYVLYVFHIELVQILMNFIDSKSYLYLQLLSVEGNQITPFDKVNIINLFIFISFSLKYKRLSKNPMTAVLLKILACSIIVVPLFSSATYFSTRFRELLSSVLILLLPNCIYLFKRKKYGYYLFLSIFLLYFLQKYIFSGYLLS